MLTTLHTRGAPQRPESDVVDLLLECHGRIHRFLGVARHLADAEAVTDGEARDAAAQVARYFAVALPLHARDEDESIAPRLRGRDTTVDAALAEMTAEHTSHQGALAHLISLCQRVGDAPAARNTLRAELTTVVAELDHAFAAHLAREEAVIFPAIRATLSPVEQAAIITELRARRTET